MLQQKFNGLTRYSCRQNVSTKVARSRLLSKQWQVGLQVMIKNQSFENVDFVYLSNRQMIKSKLAMDLHHGYRQVSVQHHPSCC